MSIDTTRTEILKILEDKVPVPQKLPDNAPLYEVLQLHSLLLLELTVSFEDHFGIVIPDQDLGFALFSSLDHLAEYISNKVAATI